MLEVGSGEDHHNTTATGTLCHEHYILHRTHSLSKLGLNRLKPPAFYLHLQFGNSVSKFGLATSMPLYYVQGTYLIYSEKTDA